MREGEPISKWKRERERERQKQRVATPHLSPGLRPLTNEQLQCLIQGSYSNDPSFSEGKVVKGSEGKRTDKLIERESSYTTSVSRPRQWASKITSTV